MENIALQPYFKIEYTAKSGKPKDITDDITNQVLSVSYTDQRHGKADDINITIEDSDGKWKDSWYPEKGDKITLTIGYKGLVPISIPFLGGDKLECGEFEIDQMTISGPPDIISIKGTSISLTSDIKTIRTVSYPPKGSPLDKIPLMQIVNSVAMSSGLMVHPKNVIDTMSLKINQNKSNAEFLLDLAEQTGHIFLIRNGLVVFTKKDETELFPPVGTLTRKDVISYSMSDSTHGIYKKCVVSYDELYTKKKITVTAENKDSPTDNILKIEKPFANEAEAKKYAESQLGNKSPAKKASFTIPGNHKMVAGANILVDGFGHLDDKYRIESSTHSINRSSGYTTVLEVKTYV